MERLPLSGTKASSRDRGLSSVRNSVGAVASLSNVSTPLGRARAWIRQCLVSKCLEACISTMLEEDRLVKVHRSKAFHFFGLILLELYFKFYIGNSIENRIEFLRG